MKLSRLFLIALAAVMLFNAAALAQSSNIDFDGSVVGNNETLVTAPIGGKAVEAPFRAGEKVAAGDALVTLKTTKVYASEDGIVTGLFAVEGDSVTAVESRYGAVMYIEPMGKYTISATTAKAYDSAATKYIHVGEKVYLACTSDGEHSGEGIVTSVSGSSYTVEVTSGSFYMDETVNVYRASNYRASSRLGRGDVARISNVAVTSSGSIVKIYVANGDEVKRGDILFETLTGEYDAYYCTGNVVYSPVSGILSTMSVSQGDDVTKDQIVAKIYPENSMQIEFSINEADLADVAEGDEVSVTFNWSEDVDDAKTFDGKIAAISHVAETSEDSTETDASYTAYVDFTPDEDVRVGMTVLVTLKRAAAVSDESGDETDESETESANGDEEDKGEPKDNEFDFELPAEAGEAGAAPAFGKPETN